MKADMQRSAAGEFASRGRVLTLGGRFIASTNIVRAGWQSTRRHEIRRTMRERIGAESTVVLGQRRIEMSSFHFSVIIEQSPQSDEELLDIADALGDAGCLDASICGHRDGA